MMKKSGCC
ncbi:hypothetical protein LINPERPRIM_LOCUS6573 [Linum perenne]